MQPRIENINPKSIVGISLFMSYAENKTVDLWKSFMPQRRMIVNSLSDNLLSMQLFDSSYFMSFEATKKFQKWAAVEVADFDDVPHGMQTFVIPGGLYAVFDYKGLSNNQGIFEYIFNTWIPASEYILDNRPHFEILGQKYRNDNPASEEEIWIPIRFTNVLSNV